MQCEYCKQENADTKINDLWYHKDCYMRLRDQEDKLSTQDKLTIINCCSVTMIFIILIWLIVEFWPVLQALP